MPPKIDIFLPSWPLTVNGPNKYCVNIFINLTKVIQKTVTTTSEATQAIFHVTIWKQRRKLLQLDNLALPPTPPTPRTGPMAAVGLRCCLADTHALTHDTKKSATFNRNADPEVSRREKCAPDDVPRIAEDIISSKGAICIPGT